MYPIELAYACAWLTTLVYMWHPVGLIALVALTIFPALYYGLADSS